jgi:hypothetical protein
MWQNDEDNNPYGSFDPDSTNPALDTSCESLKLAFSLLHTSYLRLTALETMTSKRVHHPHILQKTSHRSFCHIRGI